MIRRSRFLPAVLLLLLVPAAPVSGADTVEVVVEPDSIATMLGQSETVDVVVANRTAVPAGPLTVHIDITDPTSETSVDPEDWTPTLSQRIAELAPSESRTVTWEVQPISSGDFVLYAVVLSSDSSAVAVSNAVTVEVQATRTLNPEGILPVAIAMPTVVGVALLAVLRRSSKARAKKPGSNSG